MTNNLFQNYSRKHVHFYEEGIPALLERGLSLLIKGVKKPALVDLGCGDGRLLYALHVKGFLNTFGEIVGVDISAERIKRLMNELPFVKGIVSDASKMPISTLFDFVICSQVIEHVQDDEALMTEIYRLLKSGGVAYVSSVVKRWYGAYFYFSNGSFRLDPTHLRENIPPLPNS